MMDKLLKKMFLRKKGNSLVYLIKIKTLIRARMVKVEVVMPYNLIVIRTRR